MKYLLLEEVQRRMSDPNENFTTSAARGILLIPPPLHTCTALSPPPLIKSVFQCLPLSIIPCSEGNININKKPKRRPKKCSTSVESKWDKIPEATKLWGFDFQNQNVNSPIESLFPSRNSLFEKSSSLLRAIEIQSLQSFVDIFILILLIRNQCVGVWKENRKRENDKSLFHQTNLRAEINFDCLVNYWEAASDVFDRVAHNRGAVELWKWWEKVSVE